MRRLSLLEFRLESIIQSTEEIMHGVKGIINFLSPGNEVGQPITSFLDKPLQINTHKLEVQHHILSSYDVPTLAGIHDFELRMNLKDVSSPV